MSILTTIAVLLIVAAAISVALALLGVVVGVAFHLLPIVIVVVAVLFFIKGGKVHVEWPHGKDASGADMDDDVIDVEARPHTDD